MGGSIDGSPYRRNVSSDTRRGFVVNNANSFYAVVEILRQYRMNATRVYTMSPVAINALWQKAQAFSKSNPE